MKKFENIILASDIDGTLLWQCGYVNPKNFEKIRYFTKNGGHFLFSSGRNTKDITVILGDILPLVNTPCVLCNGGMLYDVGTDTIENPAYLDTDSLVAMLADVKENFPDVGFRASYSGGFLVCSDDEQIKKELEKYNVLQFATFAELKDFPKYRFFKTIFRALPERLAELEEYLAEKYGDKVAFTRSSPYLLETMPVGITKSYQLKYLKEKLAGSYPGVELWCVGDYDNDKDMLKFADHAACPDNATDEIKKICPIHLCHCKDGAVAELIDIIESRL